MKLSLGPRGGVEIGVIFGEVGKKTPPAKLARDVSPSVDCPGPGTRANEWSTLRLLIGPLPKGRTPKK